MYLLLPPWLYALGVFLWFLLDKSSNYVTLSIGGKMKKVKITHKNGEFTGYFVEQTKDKIVVVNEKGNIEIHYPKDQCKYVFLEDK